MNKRPRYSNSLLHAGGKLTASAILKPLYSELTQKDIDSCMQVVNLRQSAAIKEKFDWCQMVVGLRCCRDIPHSPSNLVKIVGQINASDSYYAGVWVQNTGQNAQACRFSRTIRADQAIYVSSLA